MASVDIFVFVRYTEINERLTAFCKEDVYG